VHNSSCTRRLARHAGQREAALRDGDRAADAAEANAALGALAAELGGCKRALRVAAAQAEAARRESAAAAEAASLQAEAIEAALANELARTQVEKRALSV
jgi:hypothetical protein